MAGAVEHRAQQLGHAGIGDQVAARLDTDDPGEQPARIAHDAAPGSTIRRAGSGRCGRIAAAHSAGDPAKPPPRSMRSAPASSASRCRSSARRPNGSGSAMAEPMCAPMDHGSDAGRSEALERRRQLVQRDPELGVRAAGGQVRMRVGVEARD